MINVEQAEDSTANFKSKKLNVFVIKRDSRLVPFDDQKIYDALMKAEAQLNGKITPEVKAEIQEIVYKIDQEITDRFQKDIKIYEIQNIVEHILIAEKKVALAEHYINYRANRDFERTKATDINFTIEKLINKDRSVVNENANKDSEVFNTQRI